VDILFDFAAGRREREREGRRLELKVEFSSPQMAQFGYISNELYLASDWSKFTRGRRFIGVV
jgi:hypothetical protein